MLIYHYDPITGVYLRTVIADPDPLELELARQAVLDAGIAAAEAVAQASASAALAAFDQATADPDLEPNDFEEARAVFELATHALNQVYTAAVANARLQAAKVQPQHWLVPAYATAVTPPEFGWDEQAVWRNGAWRVEDVPNAGEEPTVEPDRDELAANVRSTRTRRIAAARPLTERHRDQIDLGCPPSLTPAQYLQVLAYIQALRDVPAQPGFPVEVVWPSLSPEILATLT